MSWKSLSFAPVQTSSNDSRRKSPTLVFLSQSTQHTLTVRSEWITIDRATYGLHRLALHACSLAFDHPTDPSRRVHVAAPVPDDLASPLALLGLADALSPATLGPGATARGAP